MASCIISIFTKSPHPISRLSLAILTASSAFLAPEVLGRRVTPFGMKSRIFSLFSVLARLRASVIISAPPCSTAALIRFTLYFPEPNMNLLLNSCPPNINLSSFLSCALFSIFASSCYLFYYVSDDCSFSGNTSCTYSLSCLSFMFSIL